MRTALVGLLLLISSAFAFGFEVDGFRNGMSTNTVKLMMKQSSFDTIEDKENALLAYDSPKHGGRFLATAFCKNKLVQVQKHLPPEFDRFANIIHQKSAELGNPIKAWSEIPSSESRDGHFSVTLMWKIKNEYQFVSYKNLGPNYQLDVTYEIANPCWSAGR